NGAVFLEKFIASPRHIEIQVLADTHGNFVHLFERECSIQRRHQKVIEEAPSSLLDDDLRVAMGQAAIKVARACNYIGAGTVEFLMDENRNFYFLEMNTRLQVEHPVTEAITGLDLVEQQIRVARGEKLSFSQEDLTITGSAMELRIYAEDPLEDFLPSVGTLDRYRPPLGKGIRLDNGVEEGMEIPVYYDPMLAKLITWGNSREEAIELMITAISDFEIKGVETTLSFGKFVFEHEAFRSGNFDTQFVKNHYAPEKLDELRREEAKLAALIAVRKYLEDRKQLRLPGQRTTQ
ncbi:MAG TPA: biotin carboxylase, partial [Salinimicrobium sp.]|nr:biotin carboxylase [Salinimicrobium sp.]